MKNTRIGVYLSEARNLQCYRGLFIARPNFKVNDMPERQVSISFNGSPFDQVLELGIYSLPAAYNDASISFGITLDGKLHESQTVIREIRRFSPSASITFSPFAAAAAIMQPNSDPIISVVLPDDNTMPVSLARVEKFLDRGIPGLKDTVNPIAGREIREIAISSRCLLPKVKNRPCKRAAIFGSSISAANKREYEKTFRELAGLIVEFHEDKYLIAQGALRLLEDSVTTSTPNPNSDYRP